LIGYAKLKQNKKENLIDIIQGMNEEYSSLLDHDPLQPDGMSTAKKLTRDGIVFHGKKKTKF
jgi:hypothetical protein